MKNLILTAFLMLLGFLQAQIINIPDANFKAKLLSTDTSVNNVVARDENYQPLIIDANGNNEIEISEALQVHYLFVYNSNIASLTGIEFFTNLHTLLCQNNLLTTLNISSLANLNHLSCAYNLLTTLNLSNESLIGVDFSYNNITEFDSSLLTNLFAVEGSFNNLSTLDFSNNLNYESGEFANNNLTTINLKNGNSENILFYNMVYENNPNLQFICVDDDFSEYAIYQSILNNTLGIPNNVVVSPYCSFEPGGDYYIVEGQTKFHTNNQDCDTSNVGLANVPLQMTNTAGSTSIFYSSNQGNYVSYLSEDGTYTLTPQLENPNFFTVSPESFTITVPEDGGSFNQNFCITPNGSHHDLLIELIPTTRAIPGYNSYYKIKYRNIGSTTQWGSVGLAFQDTYIDFASAVPAATSVVNSHVYWSYENLLPFESREIIVAFNLNSPLETPALNSGDYLVFTASVGGLFLTDQNPQNNAFQVIQNVVNSYDPNDKTCLQGNVISPEQIGDFVHYMIRFENNGTANAQNVVVKDLIDLEKFDVATLQFVDSSHPCITRITEGNKVEFIFEGIQLPFDDANNDGYVVFKIKSKNTLAIGDEISNQAAIYFDFNAPIITNLETSVYQTLSNTDFEFETYFTISPVPTRDFLMITNKQQLEIKHISIYNMLGQLVQTIIHPSNSIDVSSLKSGQYIVSIATENAVYKSKMAKE